MKFKSARYTGWFQPREPVRYKGPRFANGKVSIIIPFGSIDYLGPLTNCLRSVRWQEFVNHDNIEIILVYLHKEQENQRRTVGRSKVRHQQSIQQRYAIFDSVINQYQASMVDVQRSYGHFPLCLARNIGAKAAKNDTLVFIDADAILDPEFLARSLLQPGKLVTCWFSYLGKNYGNITDKKQVRLRVPEGQVRRYAYGGGIIAPRNVVHEIRGFDEVYDRAWGADDNDMVDRLMEYGLDWYNLSSEENIVNLHQWHPRTSHEKDPGTIANRKRYYSLQTVVRNEDKWGEP